MAASIDLPENYDVIVLGTGNAESIAAAALSRIGLSVLHLDRYSYYSADWASFHLNGLLEWINKQTSISELLTVIESGPELRENEKKIPMKVNSKTIRNIRTQLYIRENPIETEADVLKSEEKQTVCGDNGQGDGQIEKESLKNEGIISSQEETPAIPAGEDVSEEQAQDTNDVEETIKKEDAAAVIKEQTTSVKQWTFSEMKSQWRKFNIDLMPKVLYCRGSMVELLISSDVAKYCEFKTVSKVLTYIDNKLEQVPCSRSDVFSSKQVSMIEKRMMMKFLTFCIDYENHSEEYEGFEDKPFSEYLTHKRLSKNVKHYIQHSIAMIPENTSTIEGLRQSQKFLRSLGRYGNTAFLWPVYGSGELPQCFCRVCAVFGGVYCLSRTAQSLVVNQENQCEAIIDTEGKRLNTKWLIAESSYLSSEMITTSGISYTSRAVLFTDRPLYPDSQDNIVLLSYPVQGLSTPVTVFELPASSNACPAGLHVVHLTCKCHNGAEQDFHTLIEALFQKADDEIDTNDNRERPKILWSLMFEVEDTTLFEKSANSPENLFVVGGLNHQFDFEYSILKAKEIFDVICPNQEFLPKAPNPEDIIWDDGDGSQPADNGFNEITSDESTTLKPANQDSEEASEKMEETKKANNAANQDSEKTSEKQPGETTKANSSLN